MYSQETAIKRGCLDYFIYLGAESGFILERTKSDVKPLRKIKVRRILEMDHPLYEPGPICTIFKIGCHLKKQTLPTKCHKCVALKNYNRAIHENYI